MDMQHTVRPQGPFVSPHRRRDVHFTARVAPLRRCGRARPPKQRAGPLRRLPLLRQLAARRTRRDAYIPVTDPSIYIDTRNAQKVASILHFFKNFFVPRGDEDEIKEKADGGLPG